jgi:phosphoglycolate phosphatase
MAYQAIIFDLDGTLLDTLEDLGNAMNRVLTHEGFPIHPIDAYRYFIGDGAKMLVHRALPAEHWDQDTMQRCLKMFLAEYEQYWKVNTKPYEGIADMLHALSVRQVKMAVLSNKPDDFTQRCVSELLPDWTFAMVLGQRDGFPKKPDPTGALTIADHLQISPAEILYLGDTAVDMQTAIAARMFPVGVLWGFRPLEELQASGAKMLLHHPMDIMPLLGRS